jgi:lysophospholipase L1-like esterase
VATPMTTFWRSVAIATAMMAGMAVFQFMPLPARGERTRIVTLLRRTMGTRGLSAEAREEQTAGYYQELLDGAAGVVSKNPTALNKLIGGGPREADMGAPQLEELTANVADINDHLSSFLIYRPKPNVDLHDPRFRNVRHVTNGLGFNDRDYPFERTPHTRRIVLLGDSMARALGVEPGGGFEPRLENYLNEHDRTQNVQTFEVINMGVSGYRLTQIVDIGLEDGPKFHPDAYVLAVSWLTIARKWGLHLAQLVEQGIDPKYDFLRKVIADAGLKKGDSTAQSEARLGPFMLPTFRWAIDELKKRANEDGADFGVILIPHLKGIGSYDYDFDPARQVLRDEGVPFADLLTTFDDVDVSTLYVGDGLHPNADGHQMLFERLYQQISTDQRIGQIIKGPGAAR